MRAPAALAAWRTKTFGGDYDPVRAAVDDAVGAFSGQQPEADRLIWLKVANEIGWQAFLELYFEQKSIMDEALARGRPLRDPAADGLRPARRYFNFQEGRRNFRGLSPSAKLVVEYCA